MCIRDSHKAWIDLNIWQDPLANIRFGSGLLKNGIDSLGGVPAGVAAYNADWEKVEDVVVMFGQDVDQLDLLTTNHNYVSDVLRRVQILQGIP